MDSISFASFAIGALKEFPSCSRLRASNLQRKILSIWVFATAGKRWWIEDVRVLLYEWPTSLKELLCLLLEDDAEEADRWRR